MLIETIRKDMMAAKVKRDKVASDVLSTLYAEAINIGRKVENRLPTDIETIATVKKFIGNIDETIGHLVLRGGREEDLQKANIEKLILSQYVPTQLSEAALTEIVTAMVDAQRALGTVNMGTIMKELKIKFEGQYDGKIASTVVKTVLG